jgi:pre-mRNA-processing factor 40
MRELPINVSTRWRTAHQLVLESPQWQRDSKLQRAENLDILKAFDTYAMEIMRTHEEQVRRNKIERARRARKARDGFRALLTEMELAGEITATTKWKEFWHKVENRPEYEAILGTAGSGPLELFQDFVDDVNEATLASANKISTACRRANRAIEPSTTKEEFRLLLKDLKINSLVEPRYEDVVYEQVCFE